VVPIQIATALSMLPVMTGCADVVRPQAMV